MNLAPSLPLLITAEEFLALPEYGVHRELINGKRRERPTTMRDDFHGEIESNVTFLLELWITSDHGRSGHESGGEVGFRLKQDPVTFVGIDVAYGAHELFERTVSQGLSDFDGPPVLAVEVHSPSDTHEDVVEIIKLYLEVGTVVWVVDPDLRTVTVYRMDQDPQMFSVSREISGEPYLPGFRDPVAAFFE